MTKETFFAAIMPYPPVDSSKEFEAGYSLALERVKELFDSQEKES